MYIQSATLSFLWAQICADIDTFIDTRSSGLHYQEKKGHAMDSRKGGLPFASAATDNVVEISDYFSTCSEKFSDASAAEVGNLNEYPITKAQLRGEAEHYIHTVLLPAARRSIDGA